MTPTRSTRTALVFLTAATLLAGGASAANGANLVKWRPVSQGKNESGKSGKPILYFFTADWCGPCHIMKSEIFADREMADLIEREYVPVEVVDRSRETGSNDPEIDRLFSKYEVRGFPTLVVTRARGEKAVYVTGWSGRANVVTFLKDSKKQLAEMEKGK